MARAIKTLLLVVVLTGLIWAWAEQSQIATIREQPIVLRVVAPRDVAVSASPEAAPGQWTSVIDIPLVVQFTGPQSSVSELARLIDRQEYPPSYTLAVPKEGDEITLDLAEILRNQPILHQMHTGVGEVRQATAKVHIGRVQKYEMDVVPSYMDTVSRQAKVEPARVSVNLPKPVYDRLKEKTIRLVVPPRADQTKPISVPLPTDLEGYPIRPTPRSVTVTANVAMKSYTVPNVTVMAVAPRDFPWADYVLETDKDQWRKTIVASGPTDRVLSADDVQVYLRFQNDDIKPAAAPIPRPVEIILPPGFTLESPKPDESAGLIYFRFNKRAE